ncbi:MAG: CRISPR-associated endoribonuclease Cas6 [Archaeoglobaceae archaeon]
MKRGEGGLKEKNPRIYSQYLIPLPLPFPYNYNYYLASFIFDCFKSSGYDIHGKKCYFSYALIGKRRAKGDLPFREVTLIFSSPVFEEIKHFLEGMLKNTKISIGNSELILENVRAVRSPDFSSEAVFKTLSPITAYVSKGGSKIFLSPENEKFRKVIEEDLKRDFRELYGKECSFEIEEIIKKKRKTAEIKHGKFIAYHAEIIAKGDEEALGFAFFRGLGKKRKFGFGCLTTE